MLISNEVLSRSYLKAGKEDNTVQSLLNQIPPDERLSRVRISHTHEDRGLQLSNDRKEWFTKTLIEMGHSPAEVQQALEK